MNLIGDDFPNLEAGDDVSASASTSKEKRPFVGRILSNFFHFYIVPPPSEFEMYFCSFNCH